MSEQENQTFKKTLEYDEGEIYTSVDNSKIKISNVEDSIEERIEISKDGINLSKFNYNPVNTSIKSEYLDVALSDDEFNAIANELINNFKNIEESKRYRLKNLEFDFSEFADVLEGKLNMLKDLADNKAEEIIKTIAEKFDIDLTEKQLNEAKDDLLANVGESVISSENIIEPRFVLDGAVEDLLKLATYWTNVIHKLELINESEDELERYKKHLFENNS